MKRNQQLCLGVLFLVAFLIVTILVFTNTSESYDDGLTIAINQTFLGETLTTLMILLSNYGREYFWIAVVGVMFLFGRKETKISAMELAILFIAGIFIGQAFKFTIYRPRPSEIFDEIVLRIPVDIDSSYPSGHSIIVSIGAVFSLMKFRKRIIALLFSIESAMVCYSRIYVGAHYLLDIVAGILLAAAIVFGGLSLIDRYSCHLESLTSQLKKIMGNGLIEL